MSYEKMLASFWLLNNVNAGDDTPVGLYLAIGGIALLLMIAMAASKVLSEKENRKNQTKHTKSKDSRKDSETE